MHYEVKKKVIDQNECREDILRELPGWLAGFPEVLVLDWEEKVRLEMRNSLMVNSQFPSSFRKRTYWKPAVYFKGEKKITQ